MDTMTAKHLDILWAQLRSVPTPDCAELCNFLLRLLEILRED